MKEHHYQISIEWTGNKGKGTVDYKSYERSHTISVENKTTILVSSDPAFCGDMTKHNPEDLFLSSLSSCHMLWFLHLCTENNVIVHEYVDNPIGIMKESINGGGQFTEVTLYPIVSVKDKKSLEKLEKIHKQANELCFIANSVNFEIKHVPKGKTI